LNGEDTPDTDSRPRYRIRLVVLVGYITVVALWEEDDQTVGSLGERLFLESKTLTPIPKKLEAMGHVERTLDPADVRQLRGRLTKSGKRPREEALSVDLVEACVVTPPDLPWS
jgi:DNA-binding MarR family transcriptional regulator